MIEAMRTIISPAKTGIEIKTPATRMPSCASPPPPAAIRLSMADASLQVEFAPLPMESALLPSAFVSLPLEMTLLPMDIALLPMEMVLLLMEFALLQFVKSLLHSTLAKLPHFYPCS